MTIFILFFYLWVRQRHTHRWFHCSKEYITLHSKEYITLQFTGYCHSDFTNSSDRKSISSYCLSLSNDSPMISWKLKKQQNFAIFSCLAEYISQIRATQEDIYLQQLYSDLTCYRNSRLQKPMWITKGSTCSQKCVSFTKLTFTYHFICSQIESENIQVT